MFFIMKNVSLDIVSNSELLYSVTYLSVYESLRTVLLSIYSAQK